MPHSNQIREFVITSKGIDLVEPYIGPEGVLTGTARMAQEDRENEARLAHRRSAQSAERLLERKRRAMEERVAALRAEFEAEAVELARSIEAAADLESERDRARVRMGDLRGSARVSARSEGNGKPRARSTAVRARESS